MQRCIVPLLQSSPLKRSQQSLGAAAPLGLASCRVVMAPPQANTTNSNMAMNSAPHTLWNLASIGSLHLRLLYTLLEKVERASWNRDQMSSSEESLSLLASLPDTFMTWQLDNSTVLHCTVRTVQTKCNRYVKARIRSVTLVKEE